MQVVEACGCRRTGTITEVETDRHPVVGTLSGAPHVTVRVGTAGGVDQSRIAKLGSVVVPDEGDLCVG